MGRRRRGAGIGSPAWAGIDLCPLVGFHARDWFPRVGGDRPALAPPVDLSELVPPRGRG